jgi:hypothetical protein
MPFKYEPYQSTYVDPQSVKISETLRNRFMDNLQANDALAMAVDQMQAALPFENDVKRKKELQAELDATLTSLSERGDYENLGFAVRSATKDFTKKYSPIKENFDRYQAALKDLEDKYKNKKIDSETYARAGAYITKGYKGFEMDQQTGRVKEGTMFSAPTIYDDVDIMEKVTKALAIIKPEKYKNKSNKLAVGPDGMYTVTNEYGVEKVEEADIQTAFDMVLSDPNVKMAVQQKADMQAYDLYRAGAIPQTMQSTIDQYNKIIEGYNKEMATKKMSSAQKAQYQKAINAMQSEINKVTEAAKDPTTSYNYVKSRLEQEIINPVKDWAMLAAYKNVDSSTIYDYDEIYVKDREKMMEIDLKNVPAYTMSEVASIDVGGKTVREKLDTIDRLTNRNATIDDMIGSGVYSTAEIEKLRKEKRTNAAEIAAQQYQITTAANNTIRMEDLRAKDPTLIDMFVEAMPKARPGEIYVQFKRTFDNKNDQDWKDFESRFDAKYGKGALEKHLTQYYGGSSDLEIMREANRKSAYPMSDEAFENYAANYVGPGNIRGIKNQPTRLLTSFDDAFYSGLDEGLKDVKVASVFNYGTIQARTPEESVALTNALNGHLIGKPIDPVALAGAYNPETAAKYETGELTDYVVTKYGFDSKRNIWRMHVKGKDGDFKVVDVGGEFLTANLPVLGILSDPEVQMGTVVMREAPRGGSVDRPEIYARPIVIEKTITDPVTKVPSVIEVPAVMNIMSIGDGSPKVSFSDQSGSPIFVGSNGDPSTQYRSVDDPDVKQVIGTGKIKF